MKHALLLLLLGATSAAFAQRGALVDPTRPPMTAVESAETESTKPSGPQLQSVLISPSRRVAVISGSTVVQGGRYGNATVAAITEGSVLLRYADRKETLHLISGVLKRERRVDDATHSDKGTTQ